MVGDLANLPEEVLEALDDAAVVTDAEGTILWTSARVEALWGYTGAELQRKKLQLLISFEVAELQPESGAAERREPRVRRPDSCAP